MELFLFVLAILIVVSGLTSLFIWEHSKKSKDNCREPLVVQQRKKKSELFGCETNDLERLKARKAFIKERITDDFLFRYRTDMHELVLVISQIELEKIEGEIKQKTAKKIKGNYCAETQNASTRG